MCAGDGEGLWPGAKVGRRVSGDEAGKVRGRWTVKKALASSG